MRHTHHGRLYHAGACSDESEQSFRLLPPSVLREKDLAKTFRRPPRQRYRYSRTVSSFEQVGEM